VKLPHDMGIPGTIGGGICLIIILTIVAQFIVGKG